jgi:hypothetical protein
VNTIPGASAIKLFTAVIYDLRPSIIFVSEARPNPSEAPYSCSILLLDLFVGTNIRLGRRGMLGTNPLAFGIVYNLQSQ